MTAADDNDYKSSPAGSRNIVQRPPSEPVQYIALEPPPDRADDALSLAGIPGLIGRRRGLIAAAMLGGAGLAAAIAVLLPTMYVAEARVIVGLQGPKVMNVEAIIRDLNPDAERVQDESLILQSRTVAREVVAQLDLGSNPSFMPRPSAVSRGAAEVQGLVLETLLPWLGMDVAAPAVEPSPEQRQRQLVDILLSRVDVAMLGRSHVLSVKAEAPDGATAAAIANSFADRYLANQRQDKIDTMQRVDKFLLERIDELREQVRLSDQAVQDYRRRYGIYKSGTGSVATQQLSELNSQLLVAQAAKVEADSRLQEARRLAKGNLSAESLPQVLQSGVVGSLKQQLADAERKVAERSAAYGERHEMLRNARAEVNALAGRLNMEVRRIVEGLEREARAATARYEAVLANFAAVKAQMGEVNEKSIELDALERDALVHRNLLEAVLQRAKQTMGTSEVLQSGGKIISAAAIPDKPAFPPTLVMMLGGTFCGFLIGLCIAIVREGNDRTFRRAEQIEVMTGLPVLATLPQVRSRGAAQQVLRAPLSPYSEAVRRMSMGIEFSTPAAPPRTVLVNSAVPGEGKSLTAVSLGRQLARSGKRVLLIDCDLRSPSIHQLFRCPNEKGLADLLSGRGATIDECLHKDSESGLAVLPAGAWEPGVLHLLTSDRMSQLLALLAEHFELVILDTSPTLATADALALARLVDKVLFVVRWGHTRQDAAMAALKQLVDAQADIAGIVLSRVIPKAYGRQGAGKAAYARHGLAMFRS
jgi:capsular exopolysaccharide synthesis family protein